MVGYEDETFDICAAWTERAILLAGDRRVDEAAKASRDPDAHCRPLLAKYPWDFYLRVPIVRADLSVGKLLFDNARFAEARPLLQFASDWGQREASTLLARMYRDGLSVAADATRAEALDSQALCSHPRKPRSVPQVAQYAIGTKDKAPDSEPAANQPAPSPARETLVVATLDPIRFSIRTQQGPAMSRAIEVLPMIIGVTGHRDLVPAEVGALEGAVRDCLQQLRKLCPDTPFILLSSLAEGADRLVARVALDCGVRLVAPLPMDIAEYERDFRHDADAHPGPDTIGDFEELLRRAERKIVVPFAPGNTAGNIREAGAARDRQYAHAGCYIVRNSHLLLALWDGVRPKVEPVGGTAQIVRYRLSGLPPSASSNPLDVIDAGPLVHIVSSRTGSTGIEKQFAWRRVLIPRHSDVLYPTNGQDAGDAEAPPEPALSLSLAASPIAIGLRHLDTYNRQALELARRDPSAFAFREDDPVSDEPSLPEGFGGLRILRQHITADRLAIQFYSWRRRVLSALSVIVVVAVAFFALYEHVEEQAWMLEAYLGAQTLGWAVYLLAKQRDFHNKHLDYRALAEGLRVQFFWCLAGIDEDVSDHYLRKQRSELEWLRDALRTQLLLQHWEKPVDAAPAPTGPTRQTIEKWLLPRWVLIQCRFFKGATQRDHRKILRRGRWVNGLVGAAFVMTVVMLALRLGLEPASFGVHVETETLKPVLLVLMVVAPTIAAALGGYSKQMAFAPQAKRYQWMAALFGRAHRRLEDALRRDDLSTARQLLLELGTEALGENGDWVMMHREREPEAPSAG